MILHEVAPHSKGTSGPWKLMATARYGVGGRKSHFSVALQQNISLLLQDLLYTLTIRKSHCCTLGEGQRALRAELPYFLFPQASLSVLLGQHKLHSTFLTLSWKKRTATRRRSNRASLIVKLINSHPRLSSATVTGFRTSQKHCANNIIPAPPPFTKAFYC